MNDTVECPYCGYDNDMTDALIDGLSSDNKFDWECQYCEKDFEVFVEFEPSYSASKIEIIICELCGVATRDICEKGRTFPYPKHLKVNKICNSCYRTEYDKELDAEINNA